MAKHLEKPTKIDKKGLKNPKLVRVDDVSPGKGAKIGVSPTSAATGGKSSPIRVGDDSYAKEKIQEFTEAGFKKN